MNPPWRAMLMLMLMLIPRITGSASGEPGAAGAPPEEWLFQQYQAGDIDTLRAVLSRIPDSSAAGKFFRGVFETDGEAARYYYDQVVALFPGSVGEGWALAKLWQYHYAKGENEKARRYWQYLNERHPGHPSITFTPEFGPIKGASGVAKPPAPPPSATATGAMWTVQVGAFSKRSGAEAAAKKVKKYGEVTLQARDAGGQKLIAVLVGRLQSEEEAQHLIDRIRSETGLEGRVAAAPPQ